MRTVWCLLLSFLVQFVVQGQTITAVRGSVRDSDSLLPLSFARVHVLEPNLRTMTDRKGLFIVPLPSGSSYSKLTVAVSLVGYEPDTVVVTSANTTVSVLLNPRAFVGRMAVVLAEDPAVAIMRRVLERRRFQENSMRSYTYMLYTKFVAQTDTSTANRASGRGDTTVFSILESFSKGYYKRPGQYFNEIIQRRQTANVPPQANFVSFGTNLNAYDGEVSLLNERIQTPLSDDALDIYDFTLMSNEDADTVLIRANVVGEGRKVFLGDVYIDQRKNIPIEVRLRPNGAVNLPFDASLQYRQSFVDAGGYVVPEGLSITSSLQANIFYLISPRLDIGIETFCYDYNMNVEIDNDVFEQRRVEISDAANTYDSLYWNQNRKLTLREEERQAYIDIQNVIENPDSLQSTLLDRFIGPVTRTIARLARRPFSGFEDVFRYNRVHGAYLGLGLRFRPDTIVELETGIGYGTVDSRVYYWLRPTFFFGGRQNWSVDASVENVLQRRDDPFVVRTPLITTTSLLFGNDYGDYYYRTGGEVGLGYSWGQLRFIRNDLWARPNGVRVFVRSEHQHTAVSSDVWSLFSNPENNRLNPAIIDGVLRSIGGTLWLGYSPVRMITRTGTSLAIETSSPQFLASDFSFTLARWLGFVRLTTLPLWTLDLYASAGWSWGAVPPQRFASLESSVSGLVTGSVFRGMQVKEFYGDRYATFKVSHNFGEVIPGLLRIPDVASFGIEFILFGGVGWTSFSNETRAYTSTALPTTQGTPENTYYEVGIGINRILLFFRLDVNARLSQRSTPAINVTLSAATF